MFLNCPVLLSMLSCTVVSIVVFQHRTVVATVSLTARCTVCRFA